MKYDAFGNVTKDDEPRDAGIAVVKPGVPKGYDEPVLETPVAEAPEAAEVAWKIEPVTAGEEATWAALDRQYERLKEASAQAEFQKQLSISRNLNQARGADQNIEDEVDAYSMEFGLPKEYVRRNLERTRQMFTAGRAQELAKNSPHTAQALTDSDIARRAHDDVENLKKTEKLWGSMLQEKVGDFTQSFVSGFIGDAFGGMARGYEEFVMRAQYAAMAELQGMTGENLEGSFFVDKEGKDVFTGVSSSLKRFAEEIDVPEERRGTLLNQTARGFGQFGGQLLAAAGTLGYGGVPLLLGMGAGQAAENLDKDRERLEKEGREMEYGEAGEHASWLAQAIVTGLTEKFGVDAAMGKMTRPFIQALESSGSKTLMRLAESRLFRYAASTVIAGVSEGAQEMSEDIGHTWARKIFVDWNLSWQPDAEELLAEGFIGAIVGGVSHGLIRLGGITKGRHQQKLINDAIGAAQESKLNKRDPEAYGKIAAEAAAENGTDTVYISVSAWRTYYQKEGMNPKVRAEEHGIKNYDEANDTNGFLEMPVEHYAGPFAGTDAAKALQADTKIAEDSLTLNETVKADEELKKELSEAKAVLENIAKQNERLAGLDVAVDEIVDDVANSLRVRYGEKVARTNAALWRWFAIVNIRDELSKNPNASKEQLLARVRDAWAAGKPVIDARASLKTEIKGVGNEQHEKTGAIKESEETTPVWEGDRKTDSPSSKSDHLGPDLKIKRDAAKWAKLIDGFIKENKPPKESHVLMLEQVPVVMHMLGAKFSTLRAARHVFDGIFPEQKKNPKHHSHPEMTADVLKQIPEALTDPVAVFKSDNRFVFVLSVMDTAGKPVVVPVEINASDGKCVMAVSAFGKDGKGGLGLKMEDLVYINRQKSMVPDVSWAVPRPQVSIDFRANNIKTEEDLVKEKQKYPNYYQGINGVTAITPGGMRISLFKNANFSTFAHETAHFMLETLRNMASSADSSQWLKDEYRTVCRYLDADPAAGNFTEEQHEEFARSFEQYLMEGKAPSLDLMDVFRRFKKWMTDIYRTLIGLNIELSDDIRGVFDRMLATDAELETARVANWYADIFSSAEDMGVSKDVFDLYKRLESDSREQAEESMLAKLMAIKRAEKAKEYREQQKKVKDQLRKAYSESPAVRAKVALADGEVNLALYEKDGRFGKELESLQAKFTEDGLSLDDAARMLGYDSGDVMMDEIRNAPSEDSFIKNEATRILRERFNDLISEAELKDLAQESLHNESRMKMLLLEFRALHDLANKAGRKEGLLQIRHKVARGLKSYRVYARELLSQMTVKQIRRPYTHIMSMRKNSRLAMEAAVKGDFAKAAEFKQQEILCLALFMEANQAKATVDKAVRFFSTIRKAKDKVIARKRDMNLVNRARYVLAQYGFWGNADEFYEKLKTANAYGDNDVDISVVEKQDWRSMTLEDFEAMADEVEALWEQSRGNRTMELDGKRVEVAQVAEQIVAALEKFGIPDRPPAKTGLLHALATAMKRVEQQFTMIAGENGVLMRAIFQPMKDASVKARLKQREINGRLEKVISGLKFKSGKITAKELIDKDTGRAHVFGENDICGAAEVFGALLHTGNESNLKKLVGGWGWGQVINGTVDTTGWNRFLRRMVNEGVLTKEHFEAAQAIWDIYEELKPMSQRANKAIFGVYFKEIKYNGVDTPFGRFKGGYVPAKVDSNVTPYQKTNEIKDADRDAVKGTMPMNEPGFTKSRVESYREPLVLDPRRLVGETQRIINYAYIAPVYNDVRKVLNNRSVTNALGRYDPDFKTEVIAPWMNRCRLQTATEGRPTPWNRFASNLRSRAGAMLMFANVKNSVQQMADIIVGAAQIKNKANFLEAIFNHDRKAIMEKSEFMRDRMGESQRAMLDNVSSILLDEGPLKKADRWLLNHAYFMQQMVDDRASSIIWTAAYNDALQEGQEELQAIRHADHVVRDVMMSQNPEDVSNIESGTQFVRMFTQFSGFFVTRSNLAFTELGSIAREAGAKGSDSNLTKALKILRNKKLKAGSVIMSKLIVPGLLDTAIALALKGILPGDDDYLRELFTGGAGYISGLGGPYANTLGQGFITLANTATGGKVSPYASRFGSGPAISIVEDAFKQMSSILKSGITAERLMKLGTDLTVFPVPVPVVPMPVTRSAGYLMKVSNGDVRPTGAADFIRGTLTGTASPDSR